MRKTDSKYPFEFDLVTGRHGFKKVSCAKLTDEERKALDKIEKRLRKKTGPRTGRVRTTSSLPRRTGSFPSVAHSLPL
jgi:hypothetical protein